MSKYVYPLEIKYRQMDSMGNCIHEEDISNQGITLREYYAGLAMQGLIAGNHGGDEENIATWAVYQADCLIAELNKEAGDD